MFSFRNGHFFLVYYWLGFHQLLRQTFDLVVYPVDPFVSTAEMGQKRDYLGNFTLESHAPISCGLGFPL